MRFLSIKSANRVLSKAQRELRPPVRKCRNISKLDRETLLDKLVSIIIIFFAFAWCISIAEADYWHQPSQLVCSDCHTIHYSEGGAEPDGVPDDDKSLGPFPKLLLASTVNGLCLSCHDGYYTEAPDVIDPEYPSAAGHFTSIGSDNENAHNLGMSSEETPPGGTGGMILSCTSCHNPHGKPGGYRNLLPDPSGGSDNIIVEADQMTTPDGPGGDEPDDIYIQQNIIYRDKLSQWCCTCHPAFQGTDGTGYRHPQDANISLADHADSDHWEGSISNRVRVEADDPSVETPDDIPSPYDEVFCLSCHKAHGSAIKSSLIRADGNRMLSTCQQCHNKTYEIAKHGDADDGVFRISGEPVGDCVHCHYQHASYNGAPISGTDDYMLFTTNDNGLCYTADGSGPCHTGATDTYLGKTIYDKSAHAISSSTFNGEPVGWCIQCHTPHGESDDGELIPNLNKLLEDNVCWQCHDTVGPPDAVNIRDQNDKDFAHNVTDFSRLHDDWEEWEETYHTPNPRFSESNRHVECEDCHNDHYSKSGLHTIGYSEIPEVLLGAWGIRPTYKPLEPWVTAISYEKVRFTNTTDYLEYYLCLKCHSDWAWGPVGSPPPTTYDGTVQTNHAIEFNPYNPAYHNVAGEPAVNVPTDDVVYGTSPPVALAYLYPWGPNSEMICTDCHSNNETASSATGPHGSDHNYMLKKRFKAVAGASNNTGQAGTSGDLCFECHDWNTYSKNATGANTNFTRAEGGPGGGSRNLHAKPGHSDKAGCFTCHAAVIHGYKRKHFITYEVDGLPYYKGPAGEGIQAWSPKEERNYSKNDCRANCHPGHANANP